ncbi:MAG: 1,4-beta-xylanase, partial [Bacteroidales bacterium]|nr:1,4-beta-xylanase [Bacteroidales bacterium]
MRINKFLVVLMLPFVISSCSKKEENKIWSKEKAQNWYEQQKWITGANFTPASAINQLEMWQAETFDPASIDKELALAESIGFNTMRVFLHNLVWA